MRTLREEEVLGLPGEIRAIFMDEVMLKWNLERRVETLQVYGARIERGRGNREKAVQTRSTACLEV